MLDIVGKTDIIIHAVVTAAYRCSSIEEVITSTIGNRVAAETARGFESLLLRQKKSSFCLPTKGAFSMLSVPCGTGGVSSICCLPRR